MGLDAQTKTPDQGFEWSKALEIGHTDIDQQHLKLFGYLSELRESARENKSPDTFRKIIDNLKMYATKHFAYEEYYMDEAAYDERASHKNAHRVFVNKVTQLGNAASHQDAYDELTDFIYEWLITHINGTDRVMVAKVLGRHHGAFAGKSDAAQTSSVIDNAYKLAGLIERTSTRLSFAHVNAKRAKFSRELADISERLINLINLAEMRVEAFGCTDLDLRRLRGIAGAFATSAQVLLRIEVKGLISFAAGMVNGSRHLVFGIGAGLKAKLAQIEILLRVAGGSNELDDVLKEDVDRARQFATKVVTMEASAVPLPDLGAKAPRDRSDRDAPLRRQAELAKNL